MTMLVLGAAFYFRTGTCSYLRCELCFLVYPSTPESLSYWPASGQNMALFLLNPFGADFQEAEVIHESSECL